MAVEAASLAGKRVLIVEDEPLVAFLIEEYLADAGCEPVGPFDSVAKALKSVRSETFDLAILDINLGGEKSYPIADALIQQGTPFLFLSGYGDTGLPPGHSGVKICSKPFRGEDLTAMLASLL
jgi:DNA-binding response OmpR family regulator